MNENQKTVMNLLGLVLVGMILFAPFIYQSAKMEVGVGFGFFFSPSPPHSAQSNTCSIFNIQRLACRFLG